MNTSLSWRPASFSLKWSKERSFGLIIVTALAAFEIFNFGTTEFALSDLMGDLTFSGIRWATILALAFCGMDFAGLARLFTPRNGEKESPEAWYLFGAWLLAAAMNAILTWWGVTIALLNHETLGSALISKNLLLQIAPVFVAVMVWIIRVLMIGSFSMAGHPAIPNDRRVEKKQQYNPTNARSTVADLSTREGVPVRNMNTSPEETREGAIGVPMAAGIRRTVRSMRSGPVYEPVPEHS